MQSQKPSPRTDDFRLAQGNGELVVTFTPDGRTYTFRLDGGRLSEPSVTPPQAAAADYVDNDVLRAATELARLAVSGAPGR